MEPAIEPVEVEAANPPDHPPANPTKPWTDSWWKAAGVLALGLIIGLGFLVGITWIARPLALLFIAMCIAAALSPIVTRLAASVRRGVAILIVYGVLLLVVVVVLILLTTPLIPQIRELSERFPDILAEGEQYLDDLGLSSAQLEGLISQFGQVAQNLLSTPLAVFSGLLDIVLVVIVSIYLLIDAPKIRRFLLSMFTGKTRERMDEVGTEMVQQAGGYVNGVVINVVLVSTLTTLGLSVIGLPFPLLLGIISGLFEVFPVIGSLIAAVPVLLVALLQSPTTALITLVFVLIAQQVQGNIITPMVMKEQANVPQFIVPLAIIAGAGIGGVLGALIAVPLVAMLRVLVVRVITPFIRSQNS